jgi:ATP phosphoribosyltransferase regulatory subunit
VLNSVLTLLTNAGCLRPEIGQLQPADPFLDTTGEDLRRRIFITYNNAGAMLCLRPEFTVPIGLHHLATATAAQKYAYGGTVFRQRANEANEFLQAGFEDIGREDRPVADIDCIMMAHDVVRGCGMGDMQLVIGEQSIFIEVMEALEIPEVWRKKLLRGFGDQTLLRNHLQQLAQPSLSTSADLPASILEGLRSGDETAVINAVTDQMVSDGLPLKGGRTPEAISERLIENHALGSANLMDDKREALEAFLSIRCDLGDAAYELQTYANGVGIKLESAIATLASLNEGLSGLQGSAHYAASFGRRLDYYTGLVFEIYQRGAEKPVVGGGRYDQLLTLLGSDTEIPAVGFSVWMDRAGEAS